MAEGITEKQKPFIIKRFLAAYDNLQVGGTRRFYPVSSFSTWPEWQANTSYAVGDQVKITTVRSGTTYTKGFRCYTANSDAEFTIGKWYPCMEYEWPEGYYPVGLVYFSTRNANVALTFIQPAFNAGSSSRIVAIKNIGAVDVTDAYNVTFDVLFAPSDMVVIDI